MSEDSGSNESAPKQKRPWHKLVILLIVLGAVGFGLNKLPVQEWWNSFSAWLESIGPWAPAAFIFAYILLTVFLIPGSVLTIGAGLLFGVVQGSLWVVVGSNIGAGCAFLIARYTLRGKIQQKFGASDDFRVLDDAVEREGWKIVGLTRLSPVFPFTFLNYAYGLTKVPFWHYALTSLVTMVPGTVMWVYIGALPRLGLEGGGGTAKTVFWIVGGIATVVVTVFVTKLARKALAERTGDAGSEVDGMALEASE